jgi:hypothetical protein
MGGFGRHRKWSSKASFVAFDREDILEEPVLPRTYLGENSEEPGVSL